MRDPIRKTLTRVPHRVPRTPAHTAGPPRLRAVLAAVLAAAACTLSVTVAGAANAAVRPRVAGTDVLYAGQELQSGQSLADGDLSLVMGTDGNVVMDNEGYAVWANGKTGHPGAYLIMQSDGNLVEYYCSGTSSTDMQTDGNLVTYCNGVATWSSGTSGHPYGVWLHLQTDGNVVLYSDYGGAIWANGK
jgi:hypothetical protein